MFTPKVGGTLSVKLPGEITRMKITRVLSGRRVIGE